MKIIRWLNEPISMRWILYAPLGGAILCNIVWMTLFVLSLQHDR